MTEVQNGGTLTEELRTLVSDAEALLRAGTGADNTQAARERIQATLQELRGRLAALEQEASTRAREVDTYVRDNPWQAIAIAGGVALLVGLIMGRRG